MGCEFILFRSRGHPSPRVVVVCRGASPSSGGHCRILGEDRARLLADLSHDGDFTASLVVFGGVAPAASRRARSAFFVPRPGSC